MGEITLSKNNKNRQNTLPKSAPARAQIKPTACYGPTAPMARQADTPAALVRTSVSLEGRTSRGRAPASLEGPTPLEWVSASLEALTPLLMAFHPLLPTKALNAPSRHRCRGQRQDPRHAESLTLPGNRESGPGAVWTSPLLCCHSRQCAVWPASFHNTVPPTLVLLPCRAPRRTPATPSRGVRLPIQRSPRTMP
jgi:hypothetical protein